MVLPGIRDLHRFRGSGIRGLLPMAGGFWAKPLVVHVGLLPANGGSYALFDIQQLIQE